MRLRTKRSVGDARVTERIIMPHKRFFVLDPITNQDYLHVIMPDKRNDRDRKQAEYRRTGQMVARFPSPGLQNVARFRDERPV